MVNKRPSLKQWLFRVIAVLLPLVFLALLEALLRVGGYGYSTRFFVPHKDQGATLMVENPKFGWRFFPKHLSRQPVPVAFTPRKLPNTYRIFIFGESAAQGHPEPAYSFARILGVLLQARHPSTKFEIINTAMTAINSHVIRLIAKDCAPMDGDLWIVYMGHNEVIGPFGAGAVFGSDTPNQTLVQANLALQAMRLGQLLRNGMDHLAQAKSNPVQWGGLEMFGRTLVPLGDPRLEIIRRHFRQNLDDILNTAERAGARTLLCVPASNLDDCAPFASAHPAGFSRMDLAQWQNLEVAGREAQAAGKWSEAEAAFLSATKLDRQYAETQYQLGRCCLKLDKAREAIEHFVLARDYDALRLRADSAIEKIISEAAERHKTGLVRLLDAEKSLSIERSRPGGELFYEHVHFTFAGNYALARLAAIEVEDLLPDQIKVPNAQSSEWLTEQECANRLAWTPWDRLRVGKEMAHWLRTGPFTNQSDHVQRDLNWENTLKEWGSADPSAAFKLSFGIYTATLKQTSNDWMLHANFARLLEAGGNINGALSQWSEAARLLPQHAQFYWHAGNLLDRQGKSRDAESVFGQAIELDRDSAEAWTGLGLALAHQGRFAQAVESYQQALKRKPESAECHINLGLALLSLGDTNNAIAHEQTAIRLWPDNVSARINLGKIRQAQGELTDALNEFQKADKIEPENAVTHFNMGNVLAALGKRAEAIQHYTQSARLRPDAVEVHVALATQLKLQGKLEEAAQELSTATRLDPDDPELHFQLGKTLLEQGKKQEAAAELRQTLQLNPGHTQTVQLLSKIQP